MTDIGNHQVGFVGLGDQGGPMAVAIVEAGFFLHAWARRPQSYDALGGAAFERHDDLASLARAVDVLALCLRNVILGAAAVVAAMSLPKNGVASTPLSATD